MNRNSTCFSGLTLLFLWLAATPPVCCGAPQVVSVATDGAGNLVSIVTSANNLPPSITSQPINRLAHIGQAVAFSVNASGAVPLYYQWYSANGTIAGGTNDSVVVENLGPGDFGGYYALVANSFGSVTSVVAQLELDSDRDGLADSWEIAYFGSITNQNGMMDADGDGTSNLQEFLDGTNPTNRTSLMPRLSLRMFGGDVVVSPDLDHYQTNTLLTLTAIPDPGLSFITWAGDLAGTNNPSSLLMNSNKTVQATFGLPLNTALNLTNVVIASGDGGWYGQTNDSYDGIAARTAPLLPHQGTFSTTILKTSVTLTRDGTVSFWYRVDTLYDNDLFFVIDNNTVFPGLRTFLGTTPWTQKTSYLAAGTHTLTWTFQSSDELSSVERGELVTPEDAAFVDQVVITEYANTNLDTDGDGLPDLWEYRYFDTLAYGAHDDPDGDGVDNITEWQDGTNPASASSVNPRLAYVIEGAGTVVASPNLPKYNYGQTVTNIATPGSGWSFVTWRGPFLTQASDTSNTNNPSSMQLLTSQIVGAIFGLPLAQVTDAAGQTWARGGEVGWYGQTNVSRDGASAARSGPVGLTGQSWMETTFQGPGTLSFWWKVDSTQNADVANYLVNSVSQTPGISGVVDWQQQSLYLGTGPQTVRWQFVRNGGRDTNRLAAAWVDQIQFLTGSTLPQFVQQPASQTVLQNSNVVIQVLVRGTPPISYQLFQGTTPFGTPTNNPTLVISNVSPALSGTWTVQAANVAGVATSDPFFLTVLPVPPSNDNFANRAPLIGLSNAVAGYNFGASKEAGEPFHGGASGGASVWWSWSAPQNGKYRAVAQATNVPNDLLLGVYAGTSVSSLTTLGSDFGSMTPTNGISLEQAETLFDAVGGTSYALAVDTSGAAGEFFGLWVERIPPPANDNFANRAVLTGRSASGTSQNVSATAEPGEPAHLGLAASNSVWWTWTAPGSGTSVVSSLGSSIVPRVAIYTGSALTALTPVASGFDSGTNGETVVAFNAVAGRVYQIAVDTLFTPGGDIRLTVALNTPSLTAVSASQGAISFSVLGPPGASYVIEESVDLRYWAPFLTNMIPADGTAVFQEAIQPGPLPRFYRVRLD